MTSKKWEARGTQLVQQLQKTTDAQTIETLCKAVIQEITNAYPETPNSRRTPLSQVRKAVRAAFPSHKNNPKNTHYFFTDSGKGNIPRWEHISLSFLTFPTEDWDALGDEARQAYKEEITENITKTTTSLSDMKLQTLELDQQTQQTVQDALLQSGMSLAEFIQQACKVYARTITGKNRKYSNSDLGAVATADLLNPENKDYKTHPGKIEELTRRAIRAIQIYNDQIAPELSQKWFISASAINALTGSRVQSVKQVLDKYKQMVDGHNAKHGLTPYTSRGHGRDIRRDINLVGLIPDGLDL